MLYAVERQLREGHRVCVIIPSEGILKVELEKRGARVEVHPYDPTLRKSRLSSLRRFCGFINDVFKSFVAYRQTALDFSADLIHTNTSVTVTGGLVAKVLKIPHIFHMRESYAEFKWLWRLYEPYIVRLSKRVICVSMSIRDEFAEKNLRSGKIKVLYDGIQEEDLLPADDKDIAGFKERLGLDGAEVIGLVGRIILHRKGQDVLVKAAALLKGRYPDARIVFVGGCYPGNEFHMRNLERLIDELDVHDIIRFAGEMENPKPAYGAFDISVMASGTAEPFGMVTIESMAQGLPVVGTDLGGTREIIESGVTGLLVSPNDPQAMADAVSSLLADTAKRRRMGKAGRERVKQKFLFSSYYDAVMKEYGSICEE
jgi:glycosyltransferase involved in cell wall biosynthesis